MKTDHAYLLVFFLMFLCLTAAGQASNEEIQKAKELFKLGKKDELMPILTEQLRLDPKNYDANRMIGYYKSEPKEAIACWLTALATSPNNPDNEGVYSGLAGSYMTLKDYKNSLKYVRLYARMAKGGDFEVLAQQRLASAYSWNLMYDSAVVVLKELLKTSPNWNVYYLLGRAYYGKNAFDYAVYYYEIAIKSPPFMGIPPKARVYSGLGTAQLGAGDPRAALASYQTSVTKYIEESKTGRWQNADIEPFSNTYVSLGLTKEILQDYEGALADFENARKIFPANEDVEPAAVRVSKKLKDKQKLQAETATKFGCFEGNCGEGTGSYRYSTGDVYRGQFTLGSKQGAGVLQFTSGDVYSGTFVNDKFADGTYKKQDGSTVWFVNGQQQIKQEFAKVSTEDEQGAKKARKGGFWRALGDIVVGAAAITLVVLEEEQKLEAAEAAAAAKENKANASSGKPANTQQQSGGSSNCYYCVLYRFANGTLEMSPVYQLNSATLPAGSFSNTQPGRKWVQGMPMQYFPPEPDVTYTVYQQCEKSYNLADSFWKTKFGENDNNGYEFKRINGRSVPCR